VHRPFRATVIAPILAGVLAASAIAVAGNVGVHGGVVAQTAPRHLRIRGHVAHLMPGEPRTYKILVRNPLGVGVVVHRVRALIRQAHGPAGRCAARNLRIKRWRGIRRIPAGATRSIRLSVRLRRRAPSRCWGARWPIHYVAMSVHR
jgi:hypothetical protein